MGSKLSSMAAVLYLAGCATAFGNDELNAWHDAEIAACKHKLEAGEFKKRVDFARCLNRANKKWWVAANAPHSDLLEYAMARDLVAAEQFDKGRMTEIQYGAARAQIKAELMSEIQKRDADAAVAQAPRYVPSPPRGPITCFTTGGMTTCY